MKSSTKIETAKPAAPSQSSRPERAHEQTSHAVTGSQTSSARSANGYAP